MVILPEILHICLTNLNKEQSTFHFWGYDRYDDQKHWLVGHGTFGVCLKILGLQKPHCRNSELTWSEFRNHSFCRPLHAPTTVGGYPQIHWIFHWLHSPATVPQPLQHLHPRITQFWQLSKESHVWPLLGPLLNHSPPIVSGDQVGF